MESTLFTTGFILAVVLTGAEARVASLVGHLPAMPHKCSEQSYCTEKHAHYPQDHIDKMLTQYRVSLGHPYEGDIGRDGFEIEQQDDCKKNNSFSSIYEIKDEQGNVRVVVQAENFMQQIRIEYCLNPGQLKNRTSHFEPEHLLHNEIICRTEVMEYRFLVLSLDGRKLESVTTDIPVNCACRFLRTK